MVTFSRSSSPLTLFLRLRKALPVLLGGGHTAVRARLLHAAQLARFRPLCAHLRARHTAAALRRPAVDLLRPAVDLLRRAGALHLPAAGRPLLAVGLPRPAALPPMVPTPVAAAMEQVMEAVSAEGASAPVRLPRTSVVDRPSGAPAQTMCGADGVARLRVARLAGAVAPSAAAL